MRISVYTRSEQMRFAIYRGRARSEQMRISVYTRSEHLTFAISLSRTRTRQIRFANKRARFGIKLIGFGFLLSRTRS